MTKVLLVDKVNVIAKEMLEKEGFEVDLLNDLSEDEKLNILPDYQAVVIRSSTNLTQKYLEAGSQLKLIIRAGEGTDNIDKKFAAEKGMIVENTPGQNSHAVAELALAHMFGLARHLQKADATTRAGQWEKKKLKGTELLKKTMGLLGGGKIARHLAVMAKGIGMEVIVHDPYLKPEDIEFPLVEFEELLKKSDYLSIHVPIVDSTRGMIGEAELAKMKKSAHIINCARGGIVDEQALADAVKGGVIKGAAIDVYTKEPAVADNPLIGVDNIQLTPHLGASSDEAQVNCAVAAADQIIAYFKNNEVLNKVN
ncbi:hydroxyacid dehydrogenase [Candidatus Calescamantes bacterium]|nr:hydroxyacid dehydrogenase [Candidatus Calescamantes bacterium]